MDVLFNKLFGDSELWYFSGAAVIYQNNQEG